ncbi:MAG TPA: Ig-like domain-containing protein [Anaerolineales bacterium]|nr:Ig-like domain-containing protein [Anaerolineales bacterium]
MGKPVEAIPNPLGRRAGSTRSKARLLALVLLLFAYGSPARAQAALELDLDRNFGFAWGNQIQGSFTLRAEGPGDLVRVVFLLDGQILGEASKAPFEIPLHTGDFPLGSHTLTAQGETASGDRLTTEPLVAEFVSADVGPQFVLRMVGPLLALLAVGVAVATVGPMLFGRGTFHLGQYGAAGGAVCPRCHLPFGRHMLSPNLIFGKLERCPHCGRIGIVPRAAPEALVAAEARWAEEGPSSPAVPPDEQLHRQIEDSRYEDQR